MGCRGVARGARGGGERGVKTRLIALIAAALMLSGCTAMLLGGGGGYQPPSDTCEGEGGEDERCRK